MKRVQFFLLFCLILAGCSANKTHTVSFWNENTLISSQSISISEDPTGFIPDVPSGFQFTGWEEAFAPDRTNYHTKFVPLLNQHVPYLFPDEDGFLRPDEILTGSMLKNALLSLADPAASQLLNDFDTKAEQLTAAEAEEIISDFFPKKSIAFPTPLTRSAFAVEMNALLERQGEYIAPLGMGFPDLSPNSPLYGELVEASVAHDPGPTPINDVHLDTGWSEGWHLLEGKLYFADEFGCLAVNTIRNGFQFDNSGCYTSGNSELDTYVTTLLQSFQDDNADASRMELLRIAFDYCRDHFKYLNREAYPVGATGWEIQDAITMLSTGVGNCYKFSSAFWALARGLGFEATAVAGTINVHPHAWVIIHSDGLYFYCDPELEMAHRAEGKYDWDLFMRDRATMKTWDYGEPEGLIVDTPPSNLPQE